jgi:hypothetical protein
MVRKIDPLAEEALTLPSESRARLADMLVESLDGNELSPIDRQWIGEAKRK